MRKNYNPNKDQFHFQNSFLHQVIIPIYVSENDEFHKDSFSILKICLESLFKTTHKRTFFTCVNNGSKPEVREYLKTLFDLGKIHEVIHTDNIGKVNSIIKGIKGHNFEIVTISDSDVLFLEGWQEECYSMFKNFKKLAALSTSPNPKLLKFHTWNLIQEFLFSKRLRFTCVEDPDGLKQFADSISNFNLFKPCHYQKNLSLSINDKVGVLGAGHFVVTYRGELFEDLALKYVNFKLGGDSEGKLDELVSKKGCWRLSTSKSYSLHMGNIEEPWMRSTLKNIVGTTLDPDDLGLSPLERNNIVSVFFANRILSKILSRKIFFKKFLLFKGLEKESISDY